MSSRMDMINGSLGDKIIRYAVPLAATGILQQLFNAADLAVVGQFSGKNAMAAVGGNAPVIGLLVNLFVGISLGSNVVIAKAVGQQDNGKISKAVHTSVVVALLGGLFLAVLGELLAPVVVELLDVPVEVCPMAVKYLRIYLAGMPVILLYNFESAIFRSCGNTRTPLIALVISGILNVIFNLFFVMGFGMDVDGVAAATVLANFISSAILFAALMKTDLAIRLEPRKLRVHRDVLAQILKIGVPAGIQGMIFSFANIIVQSAVNSLGTTIMAASSAAYNLEIFSYYVMNSFGQACTTFVGQNYGAGRMDRVRRGVLECLGLSALITIGLSAVLYTWGGGIYRLFTNDAAVLARGMEILHFLAPAFILYVCIEIYSGALRGVGDCWIPMIITAMGVCVLRILWVVAVVPFRPAMSTIIISYPMSWATTTALFNVYYFWFSSLKRFSVRLPWKRKRRRRG